MNIKSSYKDQIQIILLSILPAALVSGPLISEFIVNVIVIFFIIEIFLEKKFHIFNQKCKEMDSLIEKNILNLEIRLLRYCLQKESPYLLGYNNKLEEDN